MEFAAFGTISRGNSGNACIGNHMLHKYMHTKHTHMVRYERRGSGRVSHRDGIQVGFFLVRAW